MKDINFVGFSLLKDYMDKSKITEKPLKGSILIKVLGFDLQNYTFINRLIEY